MAEPTSSSIAAAMAAGLGVASILPGVDGNAMFGAVVGAALIATNRRDIHGWQRLIGLLISAGAGYVSAGEIVEQTPISQTGPGGFIGAVLVVPLALKLLAAVDKINLEKLVADWMKRGRAE